MRVLIIEDQPSEQKLACHVLTEAGYSVMALDGAEQAFDAIALDRPEIILLDMRLPGRDGLSLVRELKANPATCAIPVVAVTSCPESYSKTDCLAAGCEAFIFKPISTRTLPDQLGKIVAKSVKPEGIQS